MATYNEMKKKADLEKDRIELRSEKVRNMIGEMPSFLIRWGNTILVIIFVLLALYPERRSERQRRWSRLPVSVRTGVLCPWYPAWSGFWWRSPEGIQRSGHKEKAADLPSTAFFSNHHSSVVLTEAQSLHSWTMHRYACSQFLRF